MKTIRGLENLSCEEQLRQTVGADQPEEEKAPGRHSSSVPVPQGGYKKAGEGLFTRIYSDRARGNGFKLQESRFRLHIKKKFFTMRVVRHWGRLPREDVDTASRKCSSPGWMGL